MIDVLTAGEAMVAVRCHDLMRLGGHAKLTVAGAESNVAIGLSRMGHRVAWGSRLGDDESGALIRRTLRGEGVDTHSAATDDAAPTGVVFFEKRLPDFTRVEYHRSGSAASLWSRDDAAAGLAMNPRIVHMSGITPALSEIARDTVIWSLEQARTQGAMVSIDLNYRSRLWTEEHASQVLTPMSRMADVVIASPEELALVADSPEELLEHGVKEIILKDGAQGARGVTVSQEVSVPALTVPVVDSIGAGDAFCAGYLSGVLEGMTLEESLHRGATVGAFAVSSAGDWEGLPTVKELSLVGEDAGGALR